MTSTAQPVAASASIPQPQDPIKLPEPDTELPELPFDKQKLTEVLKLDAMIVDAGRLEAATTLFGSMFQELKDGANASMNGTNEDQVRGVMAMVDAFAEFEKSALSMGELARDRFAKKYGDDDKFTAQYRETYSCAETELDGVISDNVVRRATSAAMGSTYKYPPRPNVSYLVSMLEESSQLRAKAVDRVISSVGTSMSVADYKKGQALVDLLNGSKSLLTLVRKLDESNDAIAKALAQVDEKLVSRSEAVAKARAAYRLPKRHEGGTASGDAAELEASLKKRMVDKGYDVKDVRLASSWRAIRSPLGVHMYNQIDFYVASTSKIADEAKANVLDVLYVTGKTGGPELKVPFAAYSVGVIAQMDAGNL